MRYKILTIIKGYKTQKKYNKKNIISALFIVRYTSNSNLTIFYFSLITVTTIGVNHPICQLNVLLDPFSVGLISLKNYFSKVFFTCFCFRTLMVINYKDGTMTEDETVLVNYFFSGIRR